MYTYVCNNNSNIQIKCYRTWRESLPSSQSHLQLFAPESAAWSSHSQSDSFIERRRQTICTHIIVIHRHLYKSVHTSLSLSLYIYIYIYTHLYVYVCQTMS